MHTTAIWGLRKAANHANFVLNVCGHRASQLIIPAISNFRCRILLFVPRVMISSRGKRYKMGPRGPKWHTILNAYTEDQVERDILDRLKELDNALAFTGELTDKRAKKRQKLLQERTALEIKILELTDMSAWNHFSALSRLYSPAKPKYPSQKNNLLRSAPSIPGGSETLSREFQATLQISDDQSSIKLEPPLSNPQRPSESMTNFKQDESQIAFALRPHAPDFGYPSQGLQAKALPNTTVPETRRRPTKHGRDKGGRDQILLPSLTSGGIPEPSATYLSFCNTIPQLSSEPRELLLVLDLNGTLLFRPNRNKSSSFIERPSTQQFLNYVLEHFSVMIWSSARLPNVELICKKLIPEHQRQRLIAIWGREQLGLSPQDFTQRVQVYKRLDRIWNNLPIQARHPQAYEGKTWHQGNTVLIDDSREKSRSEPNNFVRVEEFTGKAENPSILRDLAEYLATLRMQVNVSSYIRLQPFNSLPSTTSSSYAK